MEFFESAVLCKEFAKAAGKLRLLEKLNICKRGIKIGAEILKDFFEGF